MKMFEEELERVDAIRPSNVVGGEKIAEVYGFISEVCPNHYGMQRWVEMVIAKKEKRACTTSQRSMQRCWIAPYAVWVSKCSKSCSVSKESHSIFLLLRKQKVLHTSIDVNKTVGNIKHVDTFDGNQD
jgi:hypothetical protein